MPYHADLSKVPLSYLKERLIKDDLIPSMLPLREGLDQNIKKLAAAGVSSVAGVVDALKTKKSEELFAQKSSIDPDYLVLLSRFVRGWLPKPHPLKEDPLADEKVIAALEIRGIKTTRDLYECCEDPAGRSRLFTELKAHTTQLEQLSAVSDLCRIQWVSPVFARILYAAGFTGVDQLAKARAETVCERVIKANDREQLYKGKIGLRDMERLVYLAGSLCGL